MEPIVYTTVNKLIKQNKLKKTDLLGNKLKSEAAKRLYRDNIRVHKRHYIPKDIKKYFHEEELKGAGLLDALKKIGSTIKHTLTSKSDATEKVDKYVKTVLQGRENFPPKVRTILEKVGDKPITSINIVRTPVQKVLVEILNIVSLGAFKERLKQTPYDTLFHLRVDITVEGGQKVSLEKNEVINMDENPSVSSNSETRQIQNLTPELTINSMLNKARDIQGDKFFKYSAYDNNCQDFILALLQGSNIGTTDDYNFIKQSVQQLFTGVSKKFANFVTTLGRKFNELTKGAGLKGSSVVQSVLFDKDKYTTKEAIKWLKQHDFEGREVDEKENTLRFRQVDPDELENYSFRTKEISDGINFVIAYKTRKTNNKYMLKKKELNADKGGVKFSEKEIIRKLNKIQDRIRAHHAQTGTVGAGIFDAFTGLGESIKNLFTPAYEQAKDYVTRKEGGLASDVVHKGIPLVVGEVVEKATNYVPGLGAVVDGRQEGRKLGKQLSDYIGQTTGVGIKPIESLHIDIGSHNASSRGRNKMVGGKVKVKHVPVETLHIDLGSHNAETGGKNAMSGDGVRKKRGRKPKKELSYEKYSHAKNEPLRQLIEAREEQADKQLKKDLGAALKKITGGRLKKGSPEAKEWARKMREARMKK